MNEILLAFSYRAVIFEKVSGTKLSFELSSLGSKSRSGLRCIDHFMTAFLSKELHHQRGLRKSSIEILSRRSSQNFKKVPHKPIKEIEIIFFFIFVTQPEEQWSSG